MLELLSPASSPESVVAAVHNGADAIYLGLDNFNARRGAKNFTKEEFFEAVSYCHVRGCKVYLTLNTLISDREAEKAAEMGKLACEAGADAILVQDLGLAEILRNAFPDMPLHASTQMSIHNLAGAFAAAELGMKRVVLARELSLKQIRFISKRSPIETEVFVHGALCFCHSGQCYMSAVIGRRSGNRGACAQPCRLNYSIGRTGDEYPLSLKDNCLLEHIRELEDAGVSCLKIEGRMKRPEYTAIVTDVYSNAIRKNLMPSKEQLRQLTDAFNRDGFTDGYLTGHKENMLGIRHEPPEGMNRTFNEIRKSYTGPEPRRVPVRFAFRAHANENSILAVKDEDGNQIAVSGSMPSMAQSAPLTKASVSEQLSKTGGTPYLCADVKTDMEDGLYLPVSVLNSMRREATNQLSAARGTPKKYSYGLMPSLPHSLPPAEKLLLNAEIHSISQLVPELAEKDIQCISLPVCLMEKAADLLTPFIEKGIRIMTVLPRVITDDQTDELKRLLDIARSVGSADALCGNLGHIAYAKASGFTVRGNYGLNIYNSRSAGEISKAGLKSFTASFEMRLAAIRDLAKPIPAELIAYGRLPLMVSEQPLIQRYPDAVRDDRAIMTDRKGAAFSIFEEFGNRCEIYNSDKLYLADKMDDLRNTGVSSLRLIFTTESAKECLQLVDAYCGKSDYTPNGITRGLYYRGVE